MALSNWGSFWEKPNDAFSRVMKVSTDYFYKQLIKKHPLKAGEKILDYGCGPGFLVANFVGSDIAVIGADINPSFLEQARSKFPQYEFMQISTDNKETETVLSESLDQQKFDRIILLSIVQYFKSAKDVANVVTMLTPYLQLNGQLIIADVLHEETSSVRDAIGIFLQCVRKGKIIAFTRFILYLVLSDYRSVSNENELLFLSKDFVKHIASDSKLSVEEVSNMTPHPTRTTYIFRHNK